MELITRGDIDILFANEAEIKALFEVNNFEKAVQKIAGIVPIAAITRSEKGSVVATGDAVETVPTDIIHSVVDTTGAGDLYASGFLYGISRGWDLSSCATLGNKCAGRIIQQLGARSAKSLADLVE